ncbi:MAG: nucleotidyltransferase domain-containing protein, partial [Verrucomicrobia bacterium]|nr:nucleotidyltransferase domain-containing protein [Verrucomicrobiota bacterium]
MSLFHPTPLADLNALLAELVARWRQILGENLVGAYLQGSFAVGDFNDHSDVDFIVIVAHEITADELAALQALHAEMHARPLYWAQHLEGS